MADRAATIGLKLLYLVPEQADGMGMYARRLVPALVAARPDVRWVSVSALRPHKNLERLVAAAAGVADGVRMLDWLADPDLEGLYHSAAVFAFPSLAEGFGLPVLETMQRGLPVACARASALPEVAGAAASYFDLCGVGDIARALDAVLADRTDAARLSEAGRRRARTVTWERAARGTLGSYDRAMRDARR